MLAGGHERKAHCRADARRAGDLERPAMLDDECASDRQPEPGALLRAGIGRVDLHERLERQLDLFGSHPDAGVAHGYLDQIVLALRDHRQSAALGRELRGVRQQVDQDLFEAQLIGHDKRKVFLEPDDEDLLLLLDPALNQEDAGVHDVAQDLGLEFERERAALDLGDVEDVVDDFQEMLAGARDVGGVEAGLAGGLLVVGELLDHLAKADDGIQRRAQLVAHICQEFGFGAARHRRFHRRGLERDFGALPRDQLAQIGGIGREQRGAFLTAVAH